MLKRFKKLTSGKKVVVVLLALSFLPILLVALSVNLLIKGIKNKKIIKILCGLVLTIFTTTIAIDFYWPTDSQNEVSKIETPVEQVASESSNSTQEVSKKEENLQQESVSKEEETTNTQSTTKAEIHFIDTGNSDSILIKQGNKAALIDGGDNDDEQRVVSYLRNQGVNELEYLFATHPDADHIGGLDAVVDAISIKNIYVSNGSANTKTYSDFIQSMANKGLGSSVPLLNSEFHLGSSTFKVLSVANENDVNNNSIVLLYTNGNDKVLLMGDAGQEIEAKINVGDVDLIKVGHHGSYTSTSESFIDKVTPEYAVITCGQNNRYGHPHKETMDILKSRNIEVHRNDECGNVIFTSTGNGLKVNCKTGSYTSGNNSTSSSSSNSYSSSNNYSSNNSTNNYSSTESTTSQSTSNEGTVYWVPNGKSYHTTKSCSTLSRSKKILSGTIKESGKYDPCDRCH